MILRAAFYRDLPNERKVFDYGVRTDGQPVYRGFAKLGTATSAGPWIMIYSKFNESSMVIEEYSLEGVWDNRVALFLPYAV